jgi:hypothetical protein
MTKRQEGNDHHAAVGDVAVEEIDRVGDAHFLGRLVDLIDQRIDALGEFVGGAHLDIGAGGRLGGEVSSRFQIAVAGLGFHLVSHQNVAATGDQLGFLEAEVGVAAGLVHRCLLELFVRRAAMDSY